jgi:hypothetical protein
VAVVSAAATAAVDTAAVAAATVGNSSVCLQLQEAAPRERGCFHSSRLSTRPSRAKSLMTHNERMKYGALLGWGIGIYAVLSLVWSGFVIYNVAQGIVPRLVQLLVLVLLALIAGRSLRLNSWKDILPYSAFWALEAAALDAIYTVPFSGWALYGNYVVWLGYATLALIPLLGPLFRREIELPPHYTS